MYTFDLILDLSHASLNDILGECEQLLSYYHSNNQIINEDYQLVLHEGKIRMPVICPEQDSLDGRYCHRQISHYLELVAEKTRKPLEIRPTGRAADNLDFEVPLSSCCYILYGESFSPVLCGDTYEDIPLYRLPPLNPTYNSYQELNLWHQTYKSLQKLWSVSDYGEKYALGQIQQVNSPLSQKGRALCRQIEELTGVPTYYYLTNRRSWSEQQDRQLKCPLTGQDWLLEGATFNDFIGFKCEESRLVSSLSSMVRRRKT